MLESGQARAPAVPVGGSFLKSRLPRTYAITSQKKGESTEQETGIKTPDDSYFLVGYDMTIETE